MGEPQHIGEILPDVMREIEERCNNYRREHGFPLLFDDRKARVHRAIREFMDGQRRRRDHRNHAKQRTER